MALQSQLYPRTLPTARRIWRAWRVPLTGAPFFLPHGGQHATIEAVPYHLGRFTCASLTRDARATQGPCREQRTQLDADDQRYPQQVPQGPSDHHRPLHCHVPSVVQHHTSIVDDSPAGEASIRSQIPRQWGAMCLWSWGGSGCMPACRRTLARNVFWVGSRA
jgi:hypothetical protein